VALSLLRLVLRGTDGGARLYSLVRNREHANISWMLGESERSAPQERLAHRAGCVLGAYPNMFFVVPENEIEEFARAIARLKSAIDYERLVDAFGGRRSDEKF
jgi:Fatty acid cis/trans isomerase (CTI)